jgi:hypothetical protein
MDISRINKMVAKKLNEWADGTMTDIIDVTPKDTGNLRDSIVLERATEANPTVTFISRGAIANKKGRPYNVYQHETQYRHYTTDGTGPYYITKPVLRALPALKRKLKRGIKHGR